MAWQACKLVVIAVCRHPQIVRALKQGLYDDWDLIEALWEYTFR
jgi:hypothetical protein